MNQNELRIKNFVVDEDDEIVEIEQLNSHRVPQFTMVSKGKHLYSSNIYPISLTEEWLLKLGFVRNIRIDCGGYKRTNVWSNYSFSITIWDDGRLFYDWLGGNIEVNYVHQLQNLYFALTGVELQLSST